jgi:hypothetical protein
MEEAFTYILHNETNGKKYVGYHKGDENDGYICSSKNETFWKDFNDKEMCWRREIVFKGSTKEAFEYEQKLLENLIKEHDKFYNRARQGKWIFTEDVLKKMRGRDRSGEKNNFYGKRHTEETKRKQASPGMKNGMYGRSAVTENNLKWYTNGLEEVFCKENTQPSDWRSGRLPKAKTETVECPCCKKRFKERGLGRHIKACKY